MTRSSTERSGSSGARRAPEIAWAPLAAGLVVLVPGLVGLATGRVMLFPSLGPTAVMQAHDPESPASRPWNVVASHVLGLLAGVAAVLLFGLADAPSVFETGSLSAARVGASVLAVALAAALEILCRATHPPAASTTLLVALGSFRPNARDTLAVVAGVLLVAAAGELARRLRARPAG